MAYTKVAPRRRLDSWKEIADHLGRGVRTAMRWERERGMPVHRIPGPRGAVYALSDEIDRWIAGQDAADLAEEDDAGRRASQPAGVAVAPARGRARGVVGLGAAAVIAVAALGLALARYGDALEAPAALRLQDHSARAYGPSGRLLWTHDFQRPVPTLAPELSAPHWRSLDLDADEEPETLLSIPFPLHDRASEAGLFCLSAKGDLRWSVTPTLQHTFGASTVGPPWKLGPGKQLLTYRVGGAMRIAWVVTGQPWWPSAVLFLDAAGQQLGAFVNAGWIWTVVPAETPGGTRLLAGGVNNGHEGPVLAVLDAADPAGASPEDEGSPFACRDCGEGRPLRYLVFPTSELTRAQGRPYSWVQEIRVQGPGVLVRVQEDGFGGIYAFDASLRLQRTSWTDEFALRHRALERDRRVDHPLDACPERDGPLPPREWSRESGWAPITARRPPSRPGR